MIDVRLHRLRLLVTVVLPIALLLPGRDASGQFEGPTGLIGLVELPSIFPDYFLLPGEEPVPQAPVTIRSEPSHESAIVAVIEDPDAIRAVEHGYEELSAAVFDFRYREGESWFSITLTDGRDGWVSEGQAGTFRGLGELYDEALLYVTEAWNGRLQVRAGDEATEFSAAGDPAEQTVVVASSTTVDDDLYFLVVLLSNPPCEMEGPGAVVSTGWIPARAPDGELNLWFYSRGC